MHISLDGIYRNGKVELVDPVPEGIGGRVIVTFVGDPAEVRLEERGISREQAAQLRQRLSAFAEDWQRPEMDAYDAV